MRSPTQHVTRCVVAGIVALLPLGGAAFTFVWLEGALSSGGLREQPFYFPGLGLLLAVACVYLCGLLVTTFLGRWLWRSVDRMLERLPMLGMFYQSLKEVLGYDTARERFFQGVVLVDLDGADQLGLVTGQCRLEGEERALVFVPGSPNPASGRLLFVPPRELRRAPLRVAAALRTLVAMGKAGLDDGPAAAPPPGAGPQPTGA
ncbi:MAG: DUF502 domain-containing protein [Planctomycetota bacterium]